MIVPVAMNGISQQRLETIHFHSQTLTSPVTVITIAGYGNNITGYGNNYGNSHLFCTINSIITKPNQSPSLTSRVKIPSSLKHRRNCPFPLITASYALNASFSLPACSNRSSGDGEEFAYFKC